ncbi:MAG: hypothetical protein ACOYB2_10610 [Limnohabitans sp.]
MQQENQIVTTSTADVSGLDAATDALLRNAAALDVYAQSAASASGVGAPAGGEAGGAATATPAASPVNVDEQVAALATLTESISTVNVAYDEMATNATNAVTEAASAVTASTDTQQTALDGLRSQFETIGDTIEEVWTRADAATAGFGTASDAVWQGFGDTVVAVRGYADDLVSSIEGAASGSETALASLASAPADVSSGFQDLLTTISGIGDEIVAATADAANGVSGSSEAMSQAFADMVNAVRDYGDQAVGYMTASSDMVGANDQLASSAETTAGAVMSSAELQHAAYETLREEMVVVGQTLDEMASGSTAVTDMASNLDKAATAVVDSLSNLAAEAMTTSNEVVGAFDEISASAANVGPDEAASIASVTDALEQEAQQATETADAVAQGSAEGAAAVEHGAESMGNSFMRIQTFVATLMEARGGMAAVAAGIMGGGLGAAAGVSEEMTTVAASAIAAEGGVMGFAESMGLLTPEALAAGAAIAVVGVAAIELGKEAFETAVEMEQFALQFTILEGSAEKAGERLEYIDNLAQSFPFPVDSLMKAVATLERLNAAALVNADGLKMIADNAVMTNTSIGASAALFGRLYAAMEGGVPVTRFLMQMFRTGAITADTRNEIVRLAAEVKSGTTDMAEAWPKVTAGITRFAGATAMEADTFSGKMQLMANATHVIFDTVGEMLLPVAGLVVDAATVVIHAVARIVEVAKEVGTAVLTPFVAFGQAIHDNLVKPFMDTIPVVDAVAVVLGILAARFAVATAQMVAHNVVVVATSVAHGLAVAAKLAHVAADKALEIAEGQTAVATAESAAATAADVVAQEADTAATVELTVAKEASVVASGEAAAAAAGGAVVATEAAASTGLLAGAMGLLSGAASAVMGILTATAVTIGAVAVPVWVVIAAVAALAAAWATNFLGIRDIVGGVIDFVVGVVKVAIDVFVEIGRIVTNVVKVAFELLGGAVKLAADVIGGAINWIIENVPGLKEIGAAIGAIGEGIGTAVGAIGDAIGTVAGVVGDGIGAIADFLDGGSRKAEEAAKTTAEAQAEELAASAERTEALAAEAAGYVPNALITALPEVEAAAFKTAQQMVDGIKEGQKVVDDAWTTLVTDMADPKHFDEATRVAELAGRLTGTALAEGLASTNPVIHAEAVKAKAEIENELNQLMGSPTLDEATSGDHMDRVAYNQFNALSEAYKKYGPQILAAQEQVGRDANEALIKGYTDTQGAVDSAIERLNKDLADPAHFDTATRAAYLVGELQTLKIKEGMAAGNPALKAELENARSLIEGELMGITGTTSGESAIAKATATWPDDIRKSGEATAAAAAEAAQKTMDAYNQTVVASSSAAGSAWSKITTAIQNQQTPSEEAANLWGVLTSKAVQDGLHSQDESTRIAVQGQVDIVQKELSHVLDTIDPLTADLARQMANGLDHAALPVDASAERLARLLPEALRAGSPQVRAAAQQQIAAYATGIRNSRKTIDDAITQLNTDMKNELTRGQETARLVGALTSAALARGLRSHDPLVRADAQNVQALIVNRLEEMQFKASDIGKKTAHELSVALHSKTAEVRKAAQDSIVRAILEPLGPLGAEAGAKADEAGDLFTKALKKHHGNIKAAAAEVTKIMQKEEKDQAAAAEKTYQDQVKAWEAAAALARKHGDDPPPKPVRIGVEVKAPDPTAATNAADKVVADFVAQTTSPASVTSATNAFQSLMDQGVAGVTSKSQVAKYSNAGAKSAQAVLDGIETKTSKFYDWGENIGDAWVNGLVHAINTGKIKIEHAAENATKPLKGTSPPDEGPLRLIDVWGANVAGAWVDAFAHRVGTAGDAVSGHLTGLGSVMSAPMRPGLSAASVMPSDRVPMFSSTVSGRNVASTGDKAGIADRHADLLGKAVDEMRLQSRLMAQLVAQEPLAASPASARGELAKQEFLMMPGGRP